VTAKRADRLVELFAERELDALVVTNLSNVRYLTGFTGTNGACIVGRDERVFFTDFRYVEQAREQVRHFDRADASRGNAVTVEPCVYLPGEFGVRIEDLVIVTDEEPRALTAFPKDLVTVG
jgi:Xaa-Pro aminopeptidase